MSVTEQCTCKILIVDDNQRIHEDFRKILSRTRVEDREFDEIERAFFEGAKSVPRESGPDMILESAFQGEQALELVKESVAAGYPFDMAFVDMRMPPGWDGVETIEQLWAVDPGLQVVICTAYSDYSWSEIIDRLGQTDQLLLLKKPFDNAEVYQLASALTRKRELTQLAEERLQGAEKIVQARTSELQLAHMQSESLLNSISSIVIELEVDGTVSRWNPTAELVFSIPKDAAIGKRFEQLEINWANFDSPGYLLSCDDGTTVPRELEFYDRDERVVVVGLTSYPVLVDDHPQRFLILGKDLSDQKLFEQQLRTAQKLEAVGQLAAGVAHEINTPMQYLGDNVKYVKRSFEQIIKVVQAYQEIVELIESGVETGIPESARLDIKSSKLSSMIRNIPEALEDSEQGVAHVSRIVRAIKQFSHPGQQARTLVDLNQALETTLTVAKNEWKYIAEVVEDFEENLKPVVGYPGALNQVFLNLIVNSTHAICEKLGEDSPIKGKIKVATRTIGDHAEIRISDTGNGIPAAIQQRVFDPLFTTKGIGKGTGQGLSIVHQVVVQKHLGTIRFETEPGVGTSFIILLPFESEYAESDFGIDQMPLENDSQLPIPTGVISNPFPLDPRHPVQ